MKADKLLLLFPPLSSLMNRLIPWTQVECCRFRADLYYLLLSTSLVYLVFPILLFFIGWLHWYIWLPCTLLVVSQLYFILSKRKKEPAEIILTVGHLVQFSIIILLVVSWVYLSGVNSSGPQTEDFKKHNAVLHDLAAEDWPVRYFLDSTQTKTIGLVYYLAFYLPAGLFGKFFSYQAGTQFLFVWTLFGILLGLSWCFIFLKKADIKITLLFIFFSGADLLGMVLLQQEFPPPFEREEWWPKIWQYSGNTSLLYWVPQHAISGWLLTSIICYEILHFPKEKNLVFYFSLSPLWSAFIMLGLMPFILFGLIREKLRTVFSASNVTGMVVLAICALYYLARFPDGHKGWLWETQDFSILPRYLLFLIAEFGIYALIVSFFLRTSENAFFKLFIVGCITLCALPFYGFGMYNDFVMRSSVPALFLLQIGVFKFITREKSNRMAKYLLLCFLLIGTAIPIIQIRRALVYHYCLAPHPPISIVELDPSISVQYMGRESSLFFEVLSKKSQAATVLSDKLQEYPFFEEQIREE